MDAMATRAGTVGAVPVKPAAKTRQKVVDVSELGVMLEQGWVYRASLDGGKAIVEAA